MNRYITFRGGPSHIAKLQQMAAILGTNQSDVLRRLVESAEVQTKPAVSVALQKNNRQDSNDLTRQSITAVGA